MDQYTVKVVAAKEYISAEKRESFTILKYFVLNKKQKVIDKRRVESVALSAESVATACKDIKLPNGDSLTFITDMASLGVTAKLDVCFKQVVTGTLVRQDFAKFEASILSATLEADTSLQADKTVVTVMTAEEQVAADGSSVTALFYRVSVSVSTSFTQTIEAKTTIKAQLTGTQLSAKVTFKRADGSSYKVVVKSAVATVQRYSDMFSLFVTKKVVNSDFGAFGANLKTFFTSKMTSATKVEVQVLKQEERKSATGETTWSLGFFVKADGETVAPTLVEGASLADMSASITVKTLSGGAYGFITDTTKVASVKRVEALFSFSLSTGVAMSSKEEIKTQVAAAYGGSSTNSSVTIISIDELLTAKGDSVYTLRYELSMNGTELSARDQQSLNASQISSVMGSITNPQGKPYVTVDTFSIELKSAASCTTMALSRVIQTSDKQAVQTAIQSTIVKSITGKIVVVEAVEILRQRESVSVTGATVWLVDYVVKISGELVAPDSLPTLSPATLMASFPTPSDGEAYSVLADDSTMLVFDMAYRLTTKQEVRSTEFTAFQSVLVESFKASSTKYASSNVAIKIWKVEELVDSATGISLFMAVYTVSVDDVMLDARFDAVADSSVIANKVTVAKIEGAAGFYEVVTTTTTSTSRVSLSSSLLVKGLVAMTDMSVMAEALQVIVRKDTTLSTATVKVLQQLEVFDAAGDVFTKLRYTVSVDGKAIVPGAMAALDIKAAMTEMASKTFSLAGGYSLEEESKVTTLNARDLMSFSLKTPVLAADVDAFQKEVAATLKTRTEFSGKKVSVSIVRQQESFQADGKSIWKVYFSVSVDDKVMSSRNIKVISTAELTSTLAKVTVSGSTEKYSAFIAAQADIGASFKITELAFVTVKEKVDMGKFKEFASAIKATLVEQSAEYASLMIIMVKQESFFTASGEEVWRLFYSIKKDSKTIRSVDVTAVLTAKLSLKLKAKGLKTSKGADFTFVAATTATVRAASLFSGITLSAKVDLADLKTFEVAIAEAYKQSLKGTGSSGSSGSVDMGVSVKVTAQKEVIVKTGAQASSGFKLFLEISVGNKTVDVQTGASLNMTAVAAAMASLKVQGSKKTYADLIMAVDKMASQLDFDSLFSLSLKAFVKKSIYVKLQVVMAAEIKTQLSLGASANVKVEIEKQEKVTVASMELVHMHFTVKVDGMVRDSRSTSLDMTKLLAAIGASADVKDSVNLLVTVPSGKALRFELSQKLFFLNRLSKADVSLLMTLIKKTYTDMASSAVIEYSRRETLTTSKGRTVQGIYYDVLIGGVQETVGIDVVKLTANLAGRMDASGEAFLVFQETSDETVLSSSTSFSVYLSTKVLSTKINSLLTALKESWEKAKTDLTDVRIRFVNQLDSFRLNGDRVFKFSYTVEAAGGFLDAEIEVGLSFNELKLAFDSIQVLDARTLGRLVVKADLSFIVVKQPVLKAHFATFKTALEQTWAELGPAVAVTVIAQEEVIARCSFIAFVLYYEATINDVTEQPKGYDEAFIAAFKLKMTQSSASGEPYSLIRISPTRTVAKTAAFSFFMTGVIASSQQKDVAAALTTAIGSVDISVEMSMQEEFMTKDGHSAWKIWYIMKAGDIPLDAEVETKLSKAAVEAALTTVDATLGSLITDVECYEFGMRFTLTLASEVLKADYGKFKAVLEKVWTAQITDHTSVTVKIMKSDEVMDSERKIAFQLIYFAFENNNVIDSRSIKAIDYSTALTGANKIVGPRGDYVVTTVTGAVRRVTQSLSVFVVGSVATEQNKMFQTALESYWTDMLEGVKVEFGMQEDYVYEGMFATSIVYFLRLNGAFVIPATLTALNMTKLQKFITFKNANSEDYKLLDEATVKLYRYRFHFSALTTIAIRNNELTTIKANLQAAWRIKIVSTSLMLSAAVREEVVTVSGVTYWRLVYFIDDAGKVINAQLKQPLDAAALKTAFDVKIVGSSQSYSDLLVTSPVITVRVSQLFTVVFQQKVSRRDFDEMETSITSAWKKVDTAYNSVKISVLKLDKMVSDQTEFVWTLRYKAALTDKLIARTDFTASASLKLKTELQTAIAIASPQGGNYMQYDTTGRTLKRYESAFYSLLIRPVLTADRDAVIDSLKGKWKGVKPSTAASLEVTFAKQEEHIDQTGKAAYKFAYFVSSDGTIQDALFEDGLSSNDMETAFDVTIKGETGTKYKDFLYTKDPANLVSFSKLIGIDVMQKVALTDYNKIEEIVKKSWVSLSTKYNTLVIKVHTQEEYLNANGEFSSRLLYSATFNTITQTLEDLPAANPAALADIEKLKSPTGDKYTLLTGATLRSSLQRYKMAMFIYLDKWVKRTDINKVTKSLFEVLKAAKTGSASLKVTFGAQEDYIDVSDRLVKFVFFVKNGDALLDGTLEEPLDKVALTGKFESNSLAQYTIKSTAQLTTANNLRKSFKLFVVGPVPQATVSTFDNTLMEDWTAAKSISGVSVDAVAKEEYIGEHGIMLTAIYYFLTSSNGLVVDPAMVKPMTAAQFVNTGAVTSTDGSTNYKLYTGTETPVQYSKQYNVAVNGDIKVDVAVTMLNAVKKVWIETTEQAVKLSFTKLERVFGKYGGALTRILYSVSLNGVVTFPDQDPQPLFSVLEEKIPADEVPLVEAVQASVAQSFGLQFTGTVKPSMVNEIEIKLKDAWSAKKNLSKSDISCKVIGQEKRMSTLGGSRTEVGQLFYTVSFRGKLADKAEVAPSDVPLPSPLKIFKLGSVRVRSLLLSSSLKGASANFADGVKTAWALLNSGSTFEVKFVSEEKYSTKSWTSVGKVSYTVTVEGKDPESMSLVAPTIANLTSVFQSVDASLSPPCKCLAQKNRRFVLSATAQKVTEKKTAIHTGIKSAWTKINTGISASLFAVELSTPASRKRRSTDSTGNPAMPVNYHVAVSGQEPDPLFVREPDADALSKAIEEASGLKLSDTMCNEMMLEGTSKQSEKEKITGAIKEAYRAANPQLTSDQIVVTNVKITNKDGSTVVTYCINTDGVEEPTVDEKKKALADVGKTYMNKPTNNAQSKTRSDAYIITIIIICCVAAFIILVLAFIKVMHSRRQLDKDEQQTSSQQGAYDEEDNFPGHAMYGTGTLGMTKNNKDSVSSKVQLYDHS